MRVQLERCRKDRSGSSGARFGQRYFTNNLHANVGSWETHLEVGASRADVAPRWVDRATCIGRSLPTPSSQDILSNVIHCPTHACTNP